MAGISGINNNYFYGTNASGINTLFGSLGTPTGVSALSGVISDYNTIKTGTYGKLLKAYYAKQKAEGTDVRTNTPNAATAAARQNEALKESLSNIKSKTEKLTTSASKLAANDNGATIFDKKLLMQDDGTTTEGYDMDTIYKAVKGFTEDYNKVLEVTANSSTQSLANGARSLTSTTQVMSKQLKKMGITSDKDGMLSIDEDKFKAYDVEKMKKIFNGASSYASTIAQTSARIMGTSSNKLSSIAASSYGKNTYARNGAYSANDFSSMFNSYF